MKWNNKGHEFDCYWDEIKDVESIYLFGAGDYGELAFNYLKDKIKINGFVDNDLNKKIYKGLKVFRPNEITLKPRTLIIASVSRTTFNDEAFKEICDNLFEKVYDMHTFISIFSVYKFNKVIFGEISYLPTPMCNLKCKYCLNFSPYINKPIRRDIEDLKKDLALYFNNVDYTLLFHLTGGEPFLYPQLYELVEYIGSNYRSQVGRLMITTNSTIMPSNELCDLMKYYDVTVELDDYTDEIPKIQVKLSSLIEKLRRNEIDYRIRKVDSWINLLLDEYTELNDKEAKNHFEKCKVPWQEYRKGKLYLCNYSSFAEVAEKYKVKDDEYFDFNSEFNKFELVEFRFGYSKKGYVEFCKQCQGYYNNKNIVKCAEQL